MCNPRVYVGTYAKYNAGNLDGKWISLADCKDYDAFLAQCRAAHRSERDPEFMIQDNSDFPDGLSCLEWLSRQDFDDIKQAMQEEAETQSCTIVDYSEKAIAVVGDTRPMAEAFKGIGRFNPRLTCGAGWIFSKRMETEVRQILAGCKVSDTPVQKKEDGGQFRQEYLNYVEQMNETPYWKDYYLKRKDIAVRLSDGWCIISRPNIENKFCFHDEGPDYEFYCKLMKDENKLRQYFLSENLSCLDREIENLRDENEPLYTRPLSKNGVEVLPARVIYGYYDYIHGKKEPRQITKEERETLLKAYGIVRAEFEKRLQTYLKRYGVSKLHTWTYWADA